MVLVVGKDSDVYSLVNANQNQWEVISSGNAKEISAGPFSQPWIVGKDRYVYTAAKFDYN